MDCIVSYRSPSCHCHLDDCDLDGGDLDGGDLDGGDLDGGDLDVGHHGADLDGNLLMTTNLLGSSM